MAVETIKDDSQTTVVEGEGFSKLIDGIPKQDTQDNTDNLIDTKEPTETEEEKQAKLEEERLKKEEEDNKKKELEQQQQSSDNKHKESDGDSIISIFKDKYGDVEDEFEETIEGLEKYFDTVIPSIKEEAKQEAIEELKSTRPEIAALIEHLDAGYGLDSFGVEKRLFDYSKVAIDDSDENIEVQQELYRQALQLKGLDEDDIKDQLELAKDKGTLKAKAETAKTFLINAQKAEVDKIKAQEKVARDAALEEERKTVEEIKTILKGGKLGDIKLSPQEAKSLEEFGTKRDSKGVTDREKKWNSLTIEQSLILDQIVMNDFKGLGIKINKEAAKARQLKDLKAKSDETARVKLNTSNESLNNQTKAPVGNIKDWIN